jgi:hypothetical protein
MTTKKIVEPLLYALIIILSAIALTLVVVSPTDFTKTSPVYKGF